MSDVVQVPKATKAELCVLEQVFAAEIEGGRFQRKSKLVLALVERGLLQESFENRGVFACTWYDLTHAGRLLYCMSCDDVPDEPSEPA